MIFILFPCSSTCSWRSFSTSLFTIAHSLHFMELSHSTGSIANTLMHTRIQSACWSKKSHSKLSSKPLVYVTEVIYQVEDMNAQVTKWENACEKQLAILHNDNLLHANAHLDIPGNTSQIVASDKYGLHNSSWLILSLQAHKHIFSLIWFIAAFMGLVFTVTIQFSGVRCHQTRAPKFLGFLLIRMDTNVGLVRGWEDEEQNPGKTTQILRCIVGMCSCSPTKQGPSFI